jgi:hypothetical protein
MMTLQEAINSSRIKLGGEEYTDDDFQNMDSDEMDSARSLTKIEQARYLTKIDSLKRYLCLYQNLDRYLGTIQKARNRIGSTKENLRFERLFFNAAQELLSADDYQKLLARAQEDSESEVKGQ